MPDDAAYCPGCGRAMRPIELEHGRPHGRVGALPENIAGALAYFLVPAIVFLFLEPYNKSRVVRFHSVQCIAAWVAAVVIGALLRIVFIVLFFIPVLGQLLTWLLSMLVGLALFMIWIVLVVKALQGEMFKLPLLGDFAELQANKT
jgi:uncharacterized membrane protein